MSDKPLPQVGDGATVFCGSDRRAGTVISVSEREIVVQEDFYTVTKRAERYGDDVEYSFSRNENGMTWTFKPIRSGKMKGIWRQWGRKDGWGFATGYRDRYTDPHF